MADESSDATAQQNSKKRQIIVENALRIMRRKRDSMDKSVLSAIKDLVMSNPAMQKALGYQVDKSSPQKLSQPQSKKTIPQPRTEEVDQGHHMEVLAKLMALDPKGKEKVKNVIKRSQKGD